MSFFAILFFGVNVFFPNLNSSDGQVLRVSSSGAVDLGLIQSLIKPMTLILIFTASLLDTEH